MSGDASRPSPTRETSSDPNCLRSIERLFAELVGAELAEAILGDLQELRPGVEARWGKAVSWVWLALEAGRGAVVLTAQRLRPARWRRKENESVDNWNVTIRRVAAAIGLVACLPAAVLVVGGLLQSELSTPAIRSALERTLFNPDLLGFRVLIHPATILSGLVLAAGLNLVPLLRLGLERRPGTLVGTLAIRTRSVHLGVALAALGLMGVILGYAFIENFKVVPTHVQVRESEWQPVGTPRVVRVMPNDEPLTLRLYVPGGPPTTSGSRVIGIEDTLLLVATPPANGD